MTRPTPPAAPSPDTVPSFSFADVLAATDATRSNLIHWTNTGIIVAAVADTRGPGYARQFSGFNLLEVQTAYVLNRFRVPVSLIGQAVRALRDHHEMCEAIWTVNGVTGVPWNVTDVFRKFPMHRKRLSDAEREVVKQSYVRASLRRDSVAGHPRPKSARFYERAIERQHDELFSEETETAILDHARAWRLFTTSPSTSEHFYGLFLNPDEEFATVQRDALDLKETVKHTAIVVNLAPIVEHIRAVAGPTIGIAPPLRERLSRVSSGVSDLSGE